MKKEKFNSRSLLIDTIRGFTIILMIYFHLCFDLNEFGFIRIDFSSGHFGYILPRIIVFLFLFIVGLSLSLTHKEGIKWKSFIKRILKIAFFAGIISLTTYFLFPENWIYFGTLHAIVVISVFSLPFLKRPNLSLILALMLFIPSLFFDKNIPWPDLPHLSWDYISPFPWLGASLLGIFAADKKFHEILIPRNKLTLFLSFLGHHSLVIYLVHQPIIYGLTYLTKLIFQ
jgi:uncharacterized membrane protein